MILQFGQNSIWPLKNRCFTPNFLDVLLTKKPSTDTVRARSSKKIDRLQKAETVLFFVLFDYPLEACAP